MLYYGRLFNMNNMRHMYNILLIIVLFFHRSKQLQKRCDIRNYLNYVHGYFYIIYKTMFFS